jgi:hypothetical protein
VFGARCRPGEFVVVRHELFVGELVGATVADDAEE